MDDFLNIEQSSTRTAGGSTRTIRSGKRFIVSETIRLTESEYSNLITLLMNGSSDYYYTPTTTPGYMNSSDFPMAVEIDVPEKTRVEGGGSKKFGVRLKITGAEYL